MKIKPYVTVAAPAATPEGMPVFKMASNESALGMSDKARVAHDEAAASLNIYPDGCAAALRDKIGAVHNLNPSGIVCGAGSDELLQLLTKAYAGEGDNIVQSDYGFLVYMIAAMSCGAAARFAPEKNLTTDVDALLGLVDERTRIVFLANPNNPTGTYLPETELRRLREELREDVLLVIDAAYAEYMEEPDYAAGEKLVEEFENVVMTRTFSKIYGLAALRLGWAYCPPAVADVLNRIRGPFNVTGPAQAAGIAALDDQAFIERNRAHNSAERDYLQQQFGGMGLEYVPSFGNFILVKFPAEAGRNAEGIRQYLQDNGVIVRDMKPYRLDEYLRVTIGTREANRKLVDLLTEKFSRD
ncbi:histidinol-phosphate transaminase [Hyphococcus flavus]|uniref:Histidinol-phosphate aminotransferase n=1 Tax=Hyphococcus flavus TaxID=1866326 RepID=A0AAE9ZLV4_9PROT|nr:histidinol-phosphate transaminase [Hyphococcus flavus]WDI33150.1 histidinol-phosphate transaminase [Hyphococcus flavus]